jgi:hypothetical protein
MFWLGMASHPEPLPALVQPEETVVPSTAATADDARRAVEPNSPGNAHRTVLASARAATAIGKTYDPRFLRSADAIGVVADPHPAAEWYHKEAALAMNMRCRF